MGNAFDRTHEQIKRKQASREAAANPSDPSKVKRLPSGSYRPQTSTDRYEQGMIDGLIGKTATTHSDESQRLFGAYLKGIQAGSRARLARSRREAESRDRWPLQARSTPSADQIAQELAEREEGDRKRKASRGKSYLVAALLFLISCSPVLARSSQPHSTLSSSWNCNLFRWGIVEMRSATGLQNADGVRLQYRNALKAVEYIEDCPRLIIHY